MSQLQLVDFFWFMGGISKINLIIFTMLGLKNEHVSSYKNRLSIRALADQSLWYGGMPRLAAFRRSRYGQPRSQVVYLTGNEVCCLASTEKLWLPAQRRTGEGQILQN